MKIDMTGRTVLVTGGGRNIGRAIALAFAGAGANVAITVRSNEAEAAAVIKEIEALGASGLVVLADASDADDNARTVEAVSSVFGGVDCLVNNAASRAFNPFLEITLEQWNDVFRADLTGPFLLSQLVLPHMIKNGFGRIINLGGADVAKVGPNRAHFLTAKAALHSLTKAIAVEFGPAGVTANLVTPGAADTTRENPEAYPDWPLSEERMKQMFVIHRVGRPSEIADACLFLSSDQAAYITGQNLRVNGGYEM